MGCGRPGVFIFLKNTPKTLANTVNHITILPKDEKDTYQNQFLSEGEITQAKHWPRPKDRFIYNGV